MAALLSLVSIASEHLRIRREDSKLVMSFRASSLKDVHGVAYKLEVLGPAESGRVQSCLIAALLGPGFRIFSI